MAGLGLGLLVAWAPLPFGSVEPEALAGLRLGAAILLALAVPALLLPGHRGGHKPPAERLAPVAVPALALLALAVFGLVQAMPWPGSVARLVSPAHAAAWGETAEILAAAEEPAAVDGEPAAEEPAAVAGEASEATRLTLDVGATRGTALNVAALAALLVAAALVGRRRRWRRWLAVCLLAAGLFQVLYGARQLLAGSMEVWGVPVLGISGRLRGTYVNPNHVSYLLEMVLAVAFAFGWWALGKARRDPNLERRLILVLPPLLIWLALLSGLVLTKSRAGLVAALVAAGVQGLLLAARRGNWRLAPLGLVVVGVGFGIVAALGVQEGLGRVLGTSFRDASWNARLDVAGATLGLWGDFPVTGSGLGSFADAFMAVEPAAVSGSAWNHAHNDYAELAATGGLVALVLVAVGVFALVRRLQKVLLHGRRSEDRAAALAALGALASVAVHEAFDFGLALPANSFVLVALCGAAAAAGLLRRGQGDGAGDEAAAQGDDLDEV